MSTYQPYWFRNKPLLLTDYLFLKTDNLSTDWDILFDFAIPSEITALVERVSPDTYTAYKRLSNQNKNLFNTFCDCGEAQGKWVWFYTEVNCATNRKCILNMFFSPRGVLWVNGKPVLVQAFDWQKSYYITVDLKKGKNISLMTTYSPAQQDTFSVQLLDYLFEMGGDIHSLSRMGNAFHLDPIMEVYRQAFVDWESPRFPFMMFSGSDMYEPDYDITLIDSLTGPVSRKIQARLNEPVILELAELRALSEETLRNEWIRCHIRKKNGETISQEIPLVLLDYQSAADRLYEEATAFTRELPAWLEPLHSSLLQYHKFWGEKKLYFDQLLNAYRIRKHLEKLKKGLYTPDYYKKPGKQTIYIRSRLDNRIVQIQADLPSDYDPARTYPALFVFATGHGGVYCEGLEPDYMPESCLCFDVTGRGFTGGNYTGYASMMEILQWISHHFRIDEDRMYMMGYSNGGYATYALAQNIPHLPAAIFPLSSSAFPKSIRNLSNIPTYQFVSTEDSIFFNKKDEVRDKLRPYGNYHSYEFCQMLHHYYQIHLYHKDILTFMFQARRERFPRHIHFTTQRNRFLESFWVRLHGIAPGYQTATVEATLTSSTSIELKIRGSNGVTITLPPDINLKSFDIHINRKWLHLEEFTGHQVILCKRKTWQICANEPTPEYRKGSGLLDIYQDSLRIILPNPCSDKLRGMAEAFAHPHSNGLSPDLDVDYPIYTADDVPDGIFGHNLLILDSDHSNPYTKRIQDKLWLICREQGVQYHDTFLEGDYIALQAVANPYDSQRTILYITTNNEELIKKVVFTRYIILPYYCNGLHPYWNNMALLYIQNSFYRLYEPGSKLEKILT